VHLRVAYIISKLIADFFQSLTFEPGEHESQHLLAEDVADAVSYIINARKGIIIDEINLNPANNVIQFKNKIYLHSKLSLFDYLLMRLQSQ
jgi:NADP-dependent 3-hydroxy acid dehydrogenase YdfG